MVIVLYISLVNFASQAPHQTDMGKEDNLFKNVVISTERRIRSIYYLYSNGSYNFELTANIYDQLKLMMAF